MFTKKQQDFLLRLHDYCKSHPSEHQFIIKIDGLVKKRKILAIKFTWGDKTKDQLAKNHRVFNHFFNDIFNKQLRNYIQGILYIHSIWPEVANLVKNLIVEELQEKKSFDNEKKKMQKLQKIVDKKIVSI